MAETEQLSLGDILSDKPPQRETPAPATEKPLPEIPVLGDKPLPETVKDPVEKQQVERNTSRRQAMRDKEQAAQGRVRDPETGQYVKKETAEPAKEEVKEPVKEEPKAAPAAPQQEFTEKEKAFLRGMQEERNKRQQLEQRLAAIEAAKPKEPEKGFWDDPESALNKQRQEFQQQMASMRLGMSEQLARSRFQDFDEKIAKFSELAMSTPGLGQQMLTAADPATFAYNTAKNHMELQQAGGLEEMRAKIERETEARVRAKVEAELKAKADALAAERAKLPPSLSDARSTGPANRPVWSGPTSMEDILKS